MHGPVRLVIRLFQCRPPHPRAVPMEAVVDQEANFSHAIHQAYRPQACGMFMVLWLRPRHWGHRVHLRIAGGAGDPVEGVAVLCTLKSRKP